MEVYLPIAEVQINVILILFVSYVIGFLSGLFGVGGGFLMTPFLIFMGIPPAYAVANEANNILASSTSGSLTHFWKKTMDLKIGWMITAGGLVGTAIGILTALLTAFYSWRLLFMTFHGETRSDKKTFDHAHESPLVMTLPLALLAFGSIFMGMFFADYYIGKIQYVFWGDSLILHEGKHYY